MPDSLINASEKLYDNDGKQAGTYTFRKNNDGTYTVEVAIDQNYTPGNNVKGYVSFKGTLIASSDKDGHIKIPFGSDNLELDIPPDKIDYPKDKTDKYDIDVVKTGEFKREKDKLVYTVYIRTGKGTPDPIKFDDVITGNGLNLSTPTVTVQKGPLNYKDQWTYEYLADNNQGSWTTVNVTPTIQGNSISMSLPYLKGGTKDENGLYRNAECYKITYEYDLKDIKNIDVKASNKAQVSSKDEKTGKEIKDEQNYDVTINKSNKPSMSKGGKFEAQKGEIEWTIVINENGKNIAGAVLTDSMLGQIPVGADGKPAITIGPADDKNYVVTPGADGKIQKIEFKAAPGTDTNTQKYTITYTTKAEGGWNGGEVRNDAILDPDSGVSGDEIGATGSVSTGSGSITKDCDGMVVSSDKTTGIITWTVTLNVPASGLPVGTVIKDQMATGWNGTSMDQWMTRNQITTWAGLMNWGANGGSVSPYYPKATDIYFLASDGNTYTFEQINTNNPLSAGFDNLHYTQFWIKVTEPLQSKDKKDNTLTFTYSTTVDLTKANFGDTTYYNYIEVGDNKHDDAEYKYHKGGVLKTDGSDKRGTSQTASDGELTWKVTVYMDENRKSFTLTDMLPEGVELESVDLSGWMSGKLELGEDEKTFKEVNSGSHKVTGSYDAETRKVVLTLATSDFQNNPIQRGANYTFTFHCKAKDRQNLEIGKMYEFENSATVETDGGDLGSSKQKQEWTYTKEDKTSKVVDKTGVWQNNSRHMEYEVVLNPKADDLVPGKETLTLTDVLEYKHTESARVNNGDHLVNEKWDYLAHMEAALLQNSVKLYLAVPDGNGGFTTGEEVTDWSWEYKAEKLDEWNAKNTITATIPDGKALILKYDYLVSTDVREEVGDTFQLNMKNLAKLEGEGRQDDSDNKQDTWQDATSSAGITSDTSLTLYKVEKGNFKKSLAGAEFTVYRYENGQYVDLEPAKVYITNESGLFKITWKDEGFEYNTLYKVKETKAPTGYVIPNPAPEYYFYFSNEEDTTYTLPANLPDNAVDLSEISHTVYAENTKIPTTSITVEKKWQDKDGNPDTSNLPNITFELYQIASKEKPGEGAGSVTLKGTLQQGDPPSSLGNWKTIDKSYSAAGVLTFTITDVHWKWDRNGNEVGNAEPKIVLNGNEIQALDDVQVIHHTEDQWNKYYTKVYSYSMQLQPGANTLSGYVTTWNADSEWIISDFSFSGTQLPTEPQGTPYEGEYTNTLSAPNWTPVKIENLPLEGTDADGNTVYYSYYVKENSVSGYTTTYSNNNDQTGITEGKITITNKSDGTTPQPQTTSITVDKKWLRADGKTEYAPTATDKVTIQLYQKTKGSTDEGTPVQDGKVELPKADVSGADAWKHTFSGLLKKDASGTEYVYYVKEETLSGFTATYKVGENGSETTGQSADIETTANSTNVTITNTESKTSIELEKVWKNAEGNDITDSVTDKTARFELWRIKTPKDGQPGEPEKVTYQSKEQIVLPNDSADSKPWTYVFTDLPKEDTDGSTYTYYVKEINVPDGFTATFEVVDATVTQGTTDTTTSTGTTGTSGTTESGAVASSAIGCGTITFTNTETPPPPIYELPATGGSGTRMYTLSGLLLVVICWMYRERTRRRGERGARG